MYTTILRYFRSQSSKIIPSSNSSARIPAGESDLVQLHSETDGISKMPPPHFFRNTALLVLVLTSAGCAALDNHCRSGFDGFTTRIQQGFPFLPFWLVLGIQSAILGLAVSLLFSWLLYFIQLRQLKNWDISKSGNPPSPVSSWVIPTVFLFFLVFPFLLFLILVGDCESSYRWSHTLGACAGFLIGWGFVFVVYFLREIRKLRK